MLHILILLFRILSVLRKRRYIKRNLLLHPVRSTSPCRLNSKHDSRHQNADAIIHLGLLLRSSLRRRFIRQIHLLQSGLALTAASVCHREVDRVLGVVVTRLSLVVSMLHFCSEGVP